LIHYLFSIVQCWVIIINIWSLIFLALLPIIECWKIYGILWSKYRFLNHIFLIWKNLHQSLVIWVETFHTCEHNRFLFRLRLNLFWCFFSSAKFQVCFIDLSLWIPKVLNKLINSFNFFLATHFSSETLNRSVILYLNRKLFLVFCIKIRWLDFIFIIRRFIWKILIFSIRSGNINIWA